MLIEVRCSRAQAPAGDTSIKSAFATVRRRRNKGNGPADGIQPTPQDGVAKGFQQLHDFDPRKSNRRRN
jgi:hypothetical protein